MHVPACLLLVLGLARAQDGRVVAPTAPDWATAPPALFNEYLRYLPAYQYQVGARRNLALPLPASPLLS